jgi:hypothetical protein
MIDNPSAFQNHRDFTRTAPAFIACARMKEFDSKFDLVGIIAKPNRKKAKCNVTMHAKVGSAQHVRSANQLLDIATIQLQLNTSASIQFSAPHSHSHMPFPRPPRPQSQLLFSSFEIHPLLCSNAAELTCTHCTSAWPGPTISQRGAHGSLEC